MSDEYAPGQSWAGRAGELAAENELLRTAADQMFLWAGNVLLCFEDWPKVGGGDIDEERQDALDGLAEVATAYRAAKGGT